MSYFVEIKHDWMQLVKSFACQLINFCVQLNKVSVPEKYSFVLIGQHTKLNKCASLFAKESFAMSSTKNPVQ